MLTSLKIEKLFDIFDYNIEFKSEGVTILTGPNGYGKTTVLKILEALALKTDLFFGRLLFQKMIFQFSDDSSFLLMKSDAFSFFMEFPTSKMQPVYFISEQRLLVPGKPATTGLLVGAGVMSTFTLTIEKYRQELYETIKETLAMSSSINQILDSSFPHRLFDQLQGIPEDEFKQRYATVQRLQNALNEYGLTDIRADSHPIYKTENAKALSVYIEDTEKKLAVFSPLLSKLKVLTDILNEHRFSFKRIDICKEEGFKFTTDQGKPLALNDLSSGEQQEVVLLYELLFKVMPGTLVLIDEPETSLHVAWQTEFLDDLLKIIELQKINAVIATHSPQIINNHWDWTVDLEENFRCNSI